MALRLNVMRGTEHDAGDAYAGNTDGAGIVFAIHFSMALRLRRNLQSTSLWPYGCVVICTPHCIAYPAHVPRRPGQPISARGFAQAVFVLAILSANSSWKALAMSSGGPDSMTSRSGNPWLSNYLKLRGLDKLT